MYLVACLAVPCSAMLARLSIYMYIFISVNNDTPESNVSFYVTLLMLLHAPWLIMTETSLLLRLGLLSEHDKICFMRVILVPSIMLHLT